MPLCGPELELDVARRVQPDEIVVASRNEVDAADGLRVAAVQTLREAQQSSQRAHGPADAAFQRAVFLVRLLRLRLSMVTRDEPDDRNLVRFEAA